MIQHFSRKNIPILNEKHTIFEIKQSLPADLRAYFTVLNDNRKSIYDIKLRKNRFLNAKFIEAFRKLSSEQRNDFLYKILKLLEPRILLSQEAKQYEPISPKSNRITLLCAMRTMILVAVTYWIPVRFIFDGNKKEITLISQDSQQVLDLRKSLIRKSKLNDNCFVIMPYSMNFNEKKHKFKFWIPQQKFKSTYQEIWKAILLCHTQQLLKTLSQPNKIISKYEKTYWETFIDTQFEEHLNNPTFRQYFKQKAQMLQLLMTVSFNFTLIYAQNNIEIHKSSNYPQTYFVKERFKMPSIQAKRIFLDNFSKNHPYLIFHQKKQSIKNKYDLRQQRYLVSSRLIQAFIIRQVDSRIETSDAIFMVQVQQENKELSFIHFMRIQIVAINSKQSQLRIFAAFNQDQKLNQQTIVLFLQQYCEMVEKKVFRGDEKSQRNDGIQTSNNIHYTVMNDQDEDQVPVSLRQKQKFFEDEILEDRYLTRKHLVNPSTQKNYYVAKVNRLIKQWLRKSNGGLRCINEDLMQLHRETCKKFAAKIGLSVIRNPMKLLNMSLPVGIFKAQSQIQSLGRIFSYAPLLLQNAAVQTDPKQRITQVTTFLVSIGIMTVTASKSFNPILGQTYQAWVGGCPIYIEQICHHPPVMGYYIVGRGYKLYGSFQLKPTIVIDGANAQVQSTSKVQFDDGTIIQYTFPKAHVIGVMLKDRQYNYSGKAYVLDRKNLLMSELNFGPKSKSFFAGNSDPDDYVFGNLYEITKQFQQKFRQNNIPFFKPERDSTKQLNSFDGFWTNSFRINGVEVINFWTDLPCLVFEEEFPLPSNSLYREDLILLKEGDMDASQSMKEKMQQAQRRDRKLRKQYEDKLKQSQQNH